MALDPHLVLAVTRARNRLRKFAFRGGQERTPTRIAFSERWLLQFQELADAELYCPQTRRTISFWGVPVAIEDRGAHAVITFSDGSTEAVQLDVQ